MATDATTAEAKTPVTVEFNVTGFGEFAGVKHNPTEHLMSALPKHTAKLSANATVSSFTVLEVSAEGATEAFKKIVPKTKPSKQCKQIFLHFGVSARSTKFQLETLAWNEATFPVPDQRGSTPQQQAILPEEKSCLKTSIDVPKLVKELKERGFTVEASDDAGRFLCNFIFFHSLARAQKECCESLFIHVPPHSVFGPDVQEQFALALMNILARDACAS